MYSEETTRNHQPNKEKDPEKEKLFMEFLEKERQFFAAKRDEEKRNKPTTKAQQRSLMYTYLKNMDGWKIKSLKKKSFAKIQELFDKAMKRINTFVDFRTELVDESSKKAEDKGKCKAKLIEEPEMPKKRKHQIRADEELAEKLQAEINEENRIAIEKAQQVEEVNLAWDDVQAKMEADY
nr:hypothetical protein [Tanacetum cinerariifolium]